jgi:hypothetical protein
MNYGHKLTDELQKDICAFIRSGAFLHDAFRAAGVPDRAWHEWMDPKHTRGKFFKLQNAIRTAQSHAKLFAASEVKQKDPFKWLANGPGRDAPGEPGWAAMAPPADTGEGKTIDPMQIPEFAQFVHNVRVVMAAYPDARRMLDDLNSLAFTDHLKTIEQQPLDEVKGGSDEASPAPPGN